MAPSKPTLAQTDDVSATEHRTISVYERPPMPTMLSIAWRRIGG